MPEANEVVDPDDLKNLLDEEGQELSDEEAEAAFEASFNGSDNTGDQLKSEVEDDDVALKPDNDEVKPDLEAEPEVKDDIGGGSSNEPAKEPTMAEMFDAMEKRMDGRMRNIEGKFGTANSQIKQLLDTKAVPAKEAPSNEQITEALASGEKFKALSEEFPEWGEAMVEQIGIARDDIMGRMPDIDGLKESFNTDVDKKLVNAQLAMLEVQYEGWQDTVKTDEFKVWLSAQDADIQDLKNSEHVPDAARLLSRFKNRTIEPKKEEPKKVDPSQNSRLTNAIPATDSHSAKPAVHSAQTEEEAFAAGFNS